jgi:putative nucleotide binding protein
MEGQENRMFETHAYILSVVPPKMYLRDSRPRGETLVQGIGESHFTLLEMVPERGATFSPEERVSIERDVESKINHVRRRIFFEDLTPESEASLPLVIEMIITKHEARYVQFFNEAAPLTTKMHSLQLLPGIGPALMWAILDERKRNPFKSFDDIAERTKLRNPKKVVAARIIDELREDVKRWIFVRPPKREVDERERPPRR